MKFHSRSICMAALLTGTATQAWAAPVTVVFQNGDNPDDYKGTFDRRITAAAEPGAGEIDGRDVTAGFGLDGGTDAVNDTGMSQVLIRFGNIENTIPAGAKILSAKITLVTKTTSNAQSGDAFSIYRLTHAFNGAPSDPSEPAASSGYTDFGTTTVVNNVPKIISDGVKGDSDWLLGSFKGPNLAGVASKVSGDVTRAVQSWVDGSPNYGVGIACDRGTNAWIFDSTGAVVVADRPKLEVTYTLDGNPRVDEFQQGLDSYAGSSDIILNSAKATIIGRTVKEAFLDGINPGTADPDVTAMIRFDGVETPLVGRKIESAKLRVVTGFSSADATSPGPFTVHRLLVPFTEASKYSDFAGTAGAMLAAGQITPAIGTFTSMANCEVLDMDISAAVKAWAAGEPNYGLYIGSGTANGWQFFTTGGTDVNFRPRIRVISSPGLPIEVVAPVASSRHVQGTPFTFDVSASATAPTTISQVEFFVDGVSVAVDTTFPYSFSYPPNKLGNFVLTAVSTDSTGAKVTTEAVPFSVVPAAGTTGLYFDGISDQVGLGNPAELKLSNLTLETWFRRETKGIATTTGTGGVIAIPLVAKGRNEGDNSTLDTNWFLGIRESDGVLCADFEGAAGANAPIAGRTVIPYDQWQHAAATFDGTFWRIYLNGNLEGEIDTKGLLPRADSIQFASIATAMNSGGLGEGAFGGFMDEVRIWNRARTQAEIRAGLNSEIPSASGLVARFAMNEGTGTTITSSSSAGTVGVFGGVPIWTSGAVFSNNAKPSIAILTPVNNSAQLNTQPVQLTVAANDSDGSVAKVEYFDNGVSIGTVTSAPFSFTYNSPVGTRRFTAVVTDNGGDTSQTNNIVTTYVTFPSPTVPGYSAGIIDGGDEDLVTDIPAVNPAPWSMVAATASPLAFDTLGGTPGDIPANLNGSPLAYNAGLLLTTNAALYGSLTAVDNIVAPYNADGVYHVSSRDNNGPGEIDPQVEPESSSFALGWFPFAQGWTGANIAEDGTVIGGSSSLPSGAKITRTSVTSDLGVVTVSYVVNGLPTSGNLIAIAGGNDSDNVAAVSQSGDNWIVKVRDNDQSVPGGDFAILYIPSTANRVLSGKIGNLGEFTALNDELALIGATCRLTSQGYELTFGDGTVFNPSNTALFLTPDENPLAGNGADNIYSYSANGNSFVVFSHDLPGLNLALQNGGFRFLATPLDPVAPIADEVALTATVARAGEGVTGNQLVFTVTRKGSTDAPLVVNYTVGGNATSSSDYLALPGNVTIPAGSLSAQVTVSILADNLLEPEETVSITLVPGTGYTPGLSNTGVGRIADALSTLPTTTVVFQQGLNSYTGTFQKRIGTSLLGALTNTLGSAVANYSVDGVDPDVSDLIRFDNIIGSGAGQVPAGARVLKAELVLNTGTADTNQSNGPFILDRLTSPVDVNTTYPGITGGVGLEGVRAIGASTPVAGFPILALGAAGAADVTDILRSWTSGVPNYGFSLYSGGTADAWNYATIGNTNVALRPKLVVTYTTQSTREYNFKADKSALFNSASGSSTLDGMTLGTYAIQRATNNARDAFLRFPVAFANGTAGAIPDDEEILKAELLVTTAKGNLSPSAHSSGPVAIHQVLEDWTTATSFGSYGPRIGTQIAESTVAANGMGQGSTTWVDVTAIVRNWRAGAPNFGIDLKPGVTDDWLFYWPGTADTALAPRLRITTSSNSGSTETSFDQWAAAAGVAGIDIHSDNDHDGLTALMEYALGFSPVAPNVLPGLVISGNTLTLSFPKGAQAAADSKVAYHLKSSPDLVTWTEETPTTNSASMISITLPVTAANKFFRLEILYTR